MTRRGFTLFETMVALLVVGLVATSAMEAVSVGMRAAERSRRALETQALAASRLDFVALMSDDDLRSVPDTVEAGKFEAPMDEYSWTMESIPDDRHEGLYQINLTIRWDDNAFLVTSYAYRRPPVMAAQ